MGCGSEFSFCESGRAGADGMGWIGLPVWHYGHPLVLDWSYSGDVVSRAGDDAVLLHFKDPLCSWLLEIAIWRARARSFRSLICIHDRVDERRQHVCHGQGDADCAGVAAVGQHLDLIAHGCDLRRAGRTAVSNLQRSTAVLPDL